MRAEHELHVAVVVPFHVQAWAIHAPDARRWLVALVAVAALVGGERAARAACDPAHVSRDGSTWTVYTGGDVRGNLQCAFDEAVTVPGATVYLPDASYPLDGDIRVQFQGDLTFRGAAAEETVVEAADLPDGFPLHESPFEGVPGLFIFYTTPGGAETPTLTFEQLTLRAARSVAWGSHGAFNRHNMNILDVWGVPPQGAGPCCGSPPDEFAQYCPAPPVAACASGLECINYQCATLDPVRVNVVASHLRLEGQPLDCPECTAPRLFTALNGLQIGGALYGLTEVEADGSESLLLNFAGPATGSVLIVDSTFSYIHFPIGSNYALDSQWTVQRNHVDQASYGPLVIDGDGGSFEMEDNLITNVVNFGALLLSGVTAVGGNDLGPVPETFPSSRMRARLGPDNEVHGITYADGLGVIDVAGLVGEPSVDAWIGQNAILLEDTLYGGIYAEGASHLQVVENTITGLGGEYGGGIYIFGSPHAQILGNDLTDLAGVGVPLWIGGGSDHARVVDNIVAAPAAADSPGLFLGAVIEADTSTLRCNAFERIDGDGVLVFGNHNRVFGNVFTDLGGFDVVLFGEHNETDASATDDQGTDNQTLMQPVGCAP